MKNKLCLVLLGISTMLGCSRTARLYPVQGPLSAQTPLPVLVAKVTGAFSPGTISVVLSDGEICKGRWTQVPPVQVPQGANTANAPATNGMSSVWDTVYGSGFYVSHVLGARFYARAVAWKTRHRPQRGNGQVNARARFQPLFVDWSTCMATRCVAISAAES